MFEVKKIVCNHSIQILLIGYYRDSLDLEKLHQDMFHLKSIKLYSWVVLMHKQCIAY